MTGAHSFTFCGIHALALPSGALFLPDHALLCVSDLHLGKSERHARRGGPLLPPYETRATLERLARDIETAQPGMVVALGDSFDDGAAAEAMEPEDAALLAGLMEGRAWVWIGGNHDPRPTEHGGVHAHEHRVGPLVFRHIAEDAADPGEVSGHYHPKHAVPGFRAKPCFLCDGRRLMLPAYGAYTGGLDSRAPGLRGLFGPQTLAVLVGNRALPVPVGAGTARRRA